MNVSTNKRCYSYPIFNEIWIFYSLTIVLVFSLLWLVVKLFIIQCLQILILLFSNTVNSKLIEKVNFNEKLNFMFFMFQMCLFCSDTQDDIVTNQSKVLKCFTLHDSEIRLYIVNSNLDLAQNIN